MGVPVNAVVYLKSSVCSLDAITGQVLQAVLREVR